MIKKETVYKIGVLGKPHGVKGEVSFTFTDDMFDRVDADFLILDIDGILVPFFMEEYRFRNNETALIKFQDIDTQDKAKELTGCDVYFSREKSDHSENNMTWAELIGFTLIDTTTGRLIGKLLSVDAATLNTLFIVGIEEGHERLIPASEELIDKIDARNRQIRICLPEGLLDID